MLRSFDPQLLRGPLLGESNRIDGLQGCDVRYPDSRRILATRDFSDVWTPLAPIGITGRRLPRELREEIYSLSTSNTFWQCYHTKRAGLGLLGETHSSRQPHAFRINGSMRDDAFDSIYRGRKLEIIVGREVIAVNFPFVAGIRTGQTVDASRAQVPRAAELFIGIQQASPRNVCDSLEIRLNVERVVDLLNSIAARQKLPPIRVSFETNQATRSLQYHRSDFEVLMGPLYKLRFPLLQHNPQQPGTNQPVTIDRLRPHNDQRDETCDKIERVISNPAADSTPLAYRQLVIAAKIELAVHEQEAFYTTRSMAAPARNPEREYGPVTERIGAAASGLRAFYDAKGLESPDWVAVLVSQFPCPGLFEVDRAVLLDGVVGLVAKQGVGSWANGHSTRVNPFWVEGEQQYWEQTAQKPSRNGDGGGALPPPRTRLWARFKAFWRRHLK